MLLALAGAGVATFAQLYSFQGVLPVLATNLQVSPAQAALTISAATVGLAIAMIPWSALGDRIGRLRAMYIALAVATTCSFLTVAMPDVQSLLVMRVCEGLALGGVPALALAYLVSETHHSARGVAAGTYVAGTTVGGLLGRLIAGPMADWLGWRAGILAVAVLATVASAVFVFLAPAEKVPPQQSGSAPSLLTKLRANVRDPTQLTLYTQAFLLMGCFVALYNYLGFRLNVPPFSLPVALTSVLFIAYLAGTFSSRWAGSLINTQSRRGVLCGSIVVMVCGALLTLPQWLPAIVVGLVLFTAGFFAAHSVASGWAPAQATVGRSQSSALYNLSYYLGSSVLGWLGGVLYQSTNWSVFAVIMALLISCSGLLAFLALRNQRTS